MDLDGDFNVGRPTTTDDYELRDVDILDVSVNVVIKIFILYYFNMITKKLNTTIIRK